MTKVLMVQGTMSNVGKSLLVAGLCRIFQQQGLSVAPFKSQNMALNSFATREGLEIGRAQAMQAEAAGIAPSVHMNPILLKPNSDEGSQVIVSGRPIGNMAARDYFAYKRELVPVIRDAFRTLAASHDLIVIEGAGSPAEINLRDNDIVNMGMAELVDAPVLLVGDIDRGGVFAQLLGTLMLLTEEERRRVGGLVINKFRGDATLLDSGVEMLEARGGVPVVGTVPYVELNLEDEDSLTERFRRTARGSVDIAVIRFPRISNFSDFDVFGQVPELSVRFLSDPADLGTTDLLILPGSKNTIADLVWLREAGWEAEILRHHAEGRPVVGICGGYQMLGTRISDPENVECGGSVHGLGLLPVATTLAGEKKTVQTEGRFSRMSGIFSGLSGRSFSGYEIHMGETVQIDASSAAVPIADDPAVGCASGNVYGTYVHGVFDRGEIASGIVQALAGQAGVEIRSDAVVDHRTFKESQYDHLAEVLRAHLDMERISAMLRDAEIR